MYETDFSLGSNKKRGLKNAFFMPFVAFYTFAILLSDHFVTEQNYYFEELEILVVG